MKWMASQVTFDHVFSYFAISPISNFKIEVELGKSAVGTTKKGIGPTYSNRADRSGATLADIFDDELLETKLRRMADGYRKRYGDLLSKYDPEEEIARFKAYRETLADIVIDEVPLLRSAKAQGLKMVVEGAQAAGLDIAFGVSPYFNLFSALTSGDIPFRHVLKLLCGWHTSRR
jgi:adenylosuccinate synthase